MRVQHLDATESPAPAVQPRVTDPVLLDLPPLIETDRLRLRPPQAGDGAAWLDAVDETLPQLRQFLPALPWVAQPQTPESAEAFCRTGAANFLARKDLPFLMFDQAGGRLLGVAGLYRTVWQTPKTEVGYWCRTSACGHGFVTEAVSALCDYAFRHLAAVRVELITDAQNSASRRVAERCGFLLEGILRSERRAPDQSLRDVCIYARLANAS